MKPVCQHGCFTEQRESVAVLANTFLGNLSISIIKKVASSSKTLQVTFALFSILHYVKRNKEGKKFAHMLIPLQCYALKECWCRQ